MLSQQLRTTVAGSSSLLDSIDGVRNWRAAILMVATFVVALLVMAMGATTVRSGATLPLLFSLVALAVVFYGVNAAGMMMMDEANGHPSRPVVAAILSSIATSHRLVLVLLVIAAIYIAGMIAFAVLLYVCKLPGIGPLLYTVVFPVGVLVSGVAIFAVPAVIFPLSAPAIWNGASAMGGVSQLVAVARRRLLLVLILMLGVGLIAGVVGGLIGVILIGGTSFTGLLSSAILGSDSGGLPGLPAGLGGLLGGGGMSGGLGGGLGGGFGEPLGGGFGGGGLGSSNLQGYAMAAMAGGGILYAIALTL